MKRAPAGKHILDISLPIWCTHSVARLFRILALIAAFAPFAAALPAQAPQETAPPVQTEAQSAVHAGDALSTRDAIVLGLVEGITEYLPISSTGHLIIATSALGLENTTPLRNTDGTLLWYKKPTAKNPDGEPLTLKLAADTYTVVIQVGAILAVVFLYWQQICAMLQGLTGRNAAGLRLFRNVIIAVIPSATIGLALHHYKIDEKLFSIEAVIAALISGAVLMWVAENWRKNQWTNGTHARRELDTLTAKQALGIGLMQCLALWPGTSRSMVTMVGGYFCGLSPAKAAEFSFLVGLPTLAGASLLKGASSGPAMITVFGWPHVILGLVVATISAFFAVKFLVRFLTRHGLGVFALYRVILAVALAAYFFL